MGSDPLEAALARGRERAEALVEARRAASAEAFAAVARPFAGHLIAEGDSWFDYPLFDEITELLEDDHAYRIESGARWGDTAERMLYETGGKGKRLVKIFEKLAREGRVPRAILLSCGGNDIAGDRFGVLLGHASSPNPGLDTAVVDAVFTRLADTLAQLVGMLKRLGSLHFQRDIPVVVHGYGYAVPDGRGFLRTSLFAGPWLAPAFEEKGYASLDERVAIVASLMDRFNAIQQNIAANVANVGYVDARPELSNVLANDRYKQSWSNELHPTRAGFAAVARQFDEAIRRFRMP